MMYDCMHIQMIEHVNKSKTVMLGYDVQSRRRGSDTPSHVIHSWVENIRRGPHPTIATLSLPTLISYLTIGHN